MSNWENRPLRYSQEHYAALDAWILGTVINKLKQHCQKNKLRDVEDFAKTIGHNPQQDVGPARLVIHQENQREIIEKKSARGR